METKIVNIPQRHKIVADDLVVDFGIDSVLFQDLLDRQIQSVEELESDVGS